jgi:hypothetical protein
MSGYSLTGAKPVEHELIPAIGDRPPVLVTFAAQPSLISLRAGRRAALTVLRQGGPDVEERAGDAFTREIIRHNILTWSGIGKDGEAVDPTPDTDVVDEEGNVIGSEPGTISDFLAEPRLVEAADRAYVLPWSQADAEENGWSPSQNGTSAGATQGANTAGSPATQDGSGDAGTTTDAPPVPTKPKKRVRKPAKPSGS